VQGTEEEKLGINPASNFPQRSCDWLHRNVYSSSMHTNHPTSHTKLPQWQGNAQFSCENNSYQSASIHVALGLCHLFPAKVDVNRIECHCQGSFMYILFAELIP
jgi:hypothetical protein